MYTLDFVRYYRSCHLKLYGIYCGMKMFLVYSMIIDWNRVWSVLEENKWVWIRLVLSGIDNKYI